MDTKTKSTAVCDVATGICSPYTENNPKQAININETKPNKTKLIYYYDALCGWCFGFSPVITQIKKAYADKIEIEVISGGLFLGSRAGYVNDVAPHIKSGAYLSVEQRTGVKFGKPFLEDVFGAGKMTLNSLPPTIALCIVKDLLPEKELEFAETLLHAVYFDGIDPINLNGYIPYIEELGLDKNDFLSKMQNPKYEELAFKEFEKFRKSQYSGMPSLVVVTENGEKPLSNGYTNFDNIKSQLDAILNN